MKKIIITAICVLGGVIYSPNASALTISPPIFEIGANPGDNPTQSIKIFNETGIPIELYTSADNFTAKAGEEGTPEFLPAQGGEAGGLASWIEIEKGPITVMPAEEKLISYTINIPANADPGGHYAAVFFANQPPQISGSAVGLSGRLGALVLLTVTGDIKESGKIVDFGFQDKKLFYEHLPVGFSLLFENTGNIHLKPQGEIKITNLFGGISDEIYLNKEEAGGGKNILPGSSRHLEAIWARGKVISGGNWLLDKLKNEINNFALGRYEARLNLEYGAQGKNAAAKVVFWVFPWHLILVFLSAVLILVFFTIRAIRGYNRWIVKRALKNMKANDKK